MWNIAESASGLSKEVAYEAVRALVMDAARITFWLEFMNCFDEYVVFQPLYQEQISKIVKLQVICFLPPTGQCFSPHNIKTLRCYLHDSNAPTVHT